MKKKILSLVFAVLLTAMVSTSAFAADEFNWSFFSEKDDVKITIGNNNLKHVTLSSLEPSKNMIAVDGALFTVNPEIIGDDRMQTFYINITYYGVNPVTINKFAFIMDGKTYTFDSMVGESGKTRAYGNVKSMYVENTRYLATLDTIQLMTDFVGNLDKDIRVRVYGDKTYEFSLTDTQKNGIFTLFGWYVAANGTRNSNLDILTNKMNFKLITMEVTQ